jgi:hypothetical protein
MKSKALPYFRTSNIDAIIVFVFSSVILFGVDLLDFRGCTYYACGAEHQCDQ